jgi:hypothetical protein
VIVVGVNSQHYVVVGNLIEGNICRTIEVEAQGNILQLD